ncbi:MAG TPA: hypothetical protein VKY90_01330 [Candidatus Dormibacteraeota bacterium]|nr:hypothetical protein [Candidatus Dormibacteraeota bacterium]
MTEPGQRKEGARRRQALALGSGLALLALAAGVAYLILGQTPPLGHGTGTTTPSSFESSDMAGMPPLPSWANDLHVAILAPPDGTVVTENVVRMQLAFSGYQPSCFLAGTPLRPHTGHFHVLLDGTLVGMFCTPEVDLSMQNVRPGHHTITVVPALNNHQQVDQNAVALHIDYEPAHPLPWITGSPTTARPSIQILAPPSGARVSGQFTLTVRVANFHLSCPLQGKAPVPGYGGWNVNVDSIYGAMNGMATMTAISCTDQVQLSTEGLTPGRHLFIAYLVNGADQPEVPLISDQVVLNVVR